MEDSGGAAADPYRKFRSLVERADRKFARAMDLPPHVRDKSSHRRRRLFEAYAKAWKFQQENRGPLMAAGMKRWEIGDVASRIGQAYFGTYRRTCDLRFLFEAFAFYRAVQSRGYFESLSDPGAGRGLSDLGVRFKALRFYARFALVAVLMDRGGLVSEVLDGWKALLEQSRLAFPETNFKEWGQLLQDFSRFTKAIIGSVGCSRTLRYSPQIDFNSNSSTHLARMQAGRSLKLQEAILTSHHRDEVKFSDLTLDTFRVSQSLEWEPNWTAHQNSKVADYGGESGVIDMKFSSDMPDMHLPPNPRKCIIYRPSVSHLLSVIAAVCEGLSIEGIVLLYISASGGTGSHKQDLGLVLTSYGNSRYNCLYPSDLIPFTRSPLFIIIDSDVSRAFKTLHGADRGEPPILLLSPQKSTYDADSKLEGSLFTLFLTSPLQAFILLVGLSGIDRDVFGNLEAILTAGMAKWEVIICSSAQLNLAYVRVLPDPFLRRLIMRFIFCRSVLSRFRQEDSEEEYWPEIWPELPASVLPDSSAVESVLRQIAVALGVLSRFRFSNIGDL